MRRHVHGVFIVTSTTLHPYTSVERCTSRACANVFRYPLSDFSNFFLLQKSFYSIILTIKNGMCFRATTSISKSMIPVQRYILFSPKCFHTSKWISSRFRHDPLWPTGDFTFDVSTQAKQNTNSVRTLRLQLLLLRLSRFWAEPVLEVVSPKLELSSWKTLPEPLSETSRAQSERTTSCAWWSPKEKPEDCVKLGLLTSFICTSSVDSGYMLAPARMWLIAHESYYTVIII